MGLPLTADAWPPAPARTARLVVRAPVDTDHDGFAGLATDPDVRRFLGGPREPGPVPTDRPGHFVLEADGRFAGWVGIGPREAGRPGRVHAAGGDLELSYALPVAAWGRGLAEEGCRAVLAWADAHLGTPLVLCTQSANLRSLALALRLGFTEVERFEEFGAEQWFGVRQP